MIMIIIMRMREAGDGSRIGVRGAKTNIAEYIEGLNFCCANWERTLHAYPSRVCNLVK